MENLIDKSSIIKSSCLSVKRTEKSLKLHPEYQTITSNAPKLTPKHNYDKKIKVLYERRKFNILMLTDQLRNDQWDARFVDVCTILCQEGHQVTVLATKIAYGQCLELKYLCRQLRQIGGWIPKHFLGIFRRLFYAVRSLYVVVWAYFFLKPAPELLFSHCFHLGSLKLFRKLNKKCRIVVLFQAIGADQIPKSKREYRIKPLISGDSIDYNVIDEVICSSLLTTYVFTYTQRPVNGPKTIEILYPTIRQKQFPPLGAPLSLPSGAISFVAINNFSVNSNFIIAMRAFSLLYGSLNRILRQRIYLVLAGNRPKDRKTRAYLTMLNNFIISTNMQNKILLLFNIPRVLERSLIAGCYGYLHVQSQVVTQDNIIEAMAAGKPVIATNSGFPCEVIKHKETGYLLSLSAECFADAMEELILYPDKYEKMAKCIVDTYEENFCYNEFVKHVKYIVSKYDDKLLIDDSRFGNDQNIIDLNNALEIIHRNNTNLPLINVLVSHQELISDKYYKEHRLYTNVTSFSTD